MRGAGMLHPEVEAMPRADLLALQLRRLQRLVERCYQHSPFYRRKLEAAGVHPAQIRSLADLHRLPFTTRQELEAAQRQDPPFGSQMAVPPEQWLELHPFSASGTLYGIWSRRDLAYIRTVTARILAACGVQRGDRVHNSFAYGLFTGGTAVHAGAQALGACVVPIGTDGVRRQIEFLVNVKPRVLVGTPSGALYLAEQIRERGLSPADVGLQIGVLGGEPGVEAPGTRTRLQRLLGLTAYDVYGLSEVTPLAAGECGAQAGLHWTEDHHLVEVVNPKTGAPCPPGEVGVVVITPLTRDAMPLLRYWTNDLACLVPEPCACGRTHARSPGGIRGRLDAMIICQGTKFYPAQLEGILHTYPELGTEYRLILEQDDRSLVDRAGLVVEGAPGMGIPAGLADALRGRIEDELGLRMTVRLVRYGTLERTVSGGRRVEDRRHTRAGPVTKEA